MITVTCNVSLMFNELSPWACSNSVANLGPDAARITWENAISVAERFGYWLDSPVVYAVRAVREWAAETGAWDEREIADWSVTDCLATLVQNIANDLREWLNVDNCTLEECVQTYENTDWDKESGSPSASFFIRGQHVFAEVVS